MKLYYTEQEELLYSRNWPEVPPVKASIYADAIAMSKFENDMKFLIRHKVVVKNPVFARLCILLAGYDGLKPGEFYTIPNDFKIEGNTCEVLPTT